MMSVRKCLSDEVLLVARIRRFARHGCQYLIPCHAVDSGQVSAETKQDCSNYGPVALEKLLGQFKTHQFAMDFDYKFVMSPD